MSEALTLDDDLGSFEPIGSAAQRVVDGLALGDVKKIPITSREQWLETRRRYVTASDVASISGVGRRSPLQVYAEKVGEVAPMQDNRVMQKGRWLEPAVFEAIGEKYPSWNVRRAKVFLASDSLRLGATPDGIAIIDGFEGPVIVQAKVVARPQFREKWLADPDDDFSEVTAPLEYQIQTLTESMLADAVHGYVAALVHDTYTADLHIIDVPRHPAAEQRILRTVNQFWTDYIDAGRRPDAMPDKDEGILKALFPADNGDEIDLTGDNEVPGLVADLEASGATKGAAEKVQKAARTALAAKMGAACFARLADGRRLSFKTSERKGYEVAPTSYRTLRIVKG